MKNDTSTTTIILESTDDKELYVSSVWSTLFEAYKGVKGGLFFTSKKELISTTSIWKVVVRNSEVIAVTIYKSKHGLKLVALAINNTFKDIAKKALSKIIKADLKKCWMELSEAAERFVMKLGGDKYILPSHMVAKVINKEIRLSDDGVHYVRNIMGEDKEKVLLGTLNINQF